MSKLQARNFVSVKVNAERIIGRQSKRTTKVSHTCQMTCQRSLVAAPPTFALRWTLPVSVGKHLRFVKFILACFFSFFDGLKDKCSCNAHSQSVFERFTRNDSTPTNFAHLILFRNGRFWCENCFFSVVLSAVKGYKYLACSFTFSINKRHSVSECRVSWIVCRHFQLTILLCITGTVSILTARSLQHKRILKHSASWYVGIKFLKKVEYQASGQQLTHDRCRLIQSWFCSISVKRSFWDLTDKRGASWNGLAPFNFLPLCWLKNLLRTLRVKHTLNRIQTSHVHQTFVFSFQDSAETHAFTLRERNQRTMATFEKRPRLVYQMQNWWIIEMAVAAMLCLIPKQLFRSTNTSHLSLDNEY